MNNDASMTLSAGGRQKFRKRARLQKLGRQTSGIALLLLCVMYVCCVTVQAATSGKTYEIEYSVTPDPGHKTARVQMRVTQSRPLLRSVEMLIDQDRFRDFSGTGSLDVDGQTIHWRPNDSGGTLQWTATLLHRRGDGGYDVYITDDWALLRGEDLVPPAHTRVVKGAASDATLSFELPARWSAVTRYPRDGDNFVVNNPARNFDRPTGWMVLGKIGVRYESVGATQLVVAAPENQNVRRMDILAFFRWTLPEVIRVIPDFPQRLTVISAGEPIWRGGLSGPDSFFLHADRPLISENGTSTPLHELIHIGLRIRATDGADWIVEGLAEFYSIEILRRSGGVSDKRFQKSVAALADWGKQVKSLKHNRSSGAITARAVGILIDLDQEIRSSSKNKYSIDDVARALARLEQPITLNDLRDSTTQLIGTDARTLRASRLPGY